MGPMAAVPELVGIPVEVDSAAVGDSAVLAADALGAVDPVAVGSGRKLET